MTILNRAAEWIREHTGRSAFNGYQDKSRRRAWEQVAAIVRGGVNSASVTLWHRRVLKIRSEGQVTQFNRTHRLSNDSSVAHHGCKPLRPASVIQPNQKTVMNLPPQTGRF